MLTYLVYRYFVSSKNIIDQNVKCPQNSQKLPHIYEHVKMQNMHSLEELQKPQEKAVCVLMLN